MILPELPHRLGEVLVPAGQQQTGAPSAVMNAVRDALQSAGADGVDMPATREQVWRALRRRRLQPPETDGPNTGKL